MTAPVARFSCRIPVVEVIIIKKDVSEIAIEIASMIPIIILLLGIKLLYRFCVV